MKTLLFFLCLVSALVAVEPVAPRILTLTGAAHPKAIVQRVDAAAGVVLFSFADAQGKAIDTGNSLARFTAVIATPATATAAAIYAEPSDATLAAAIVAPEPAPSVVVPVTVTRRQLFLWLNTQGHTRAAIRALLEQTPDATQREAALIEFDEAQEFKRTHPLILQLAPLLGYTTSAQLDAAFTAAAQL